jgi:hypothetical protein
LKGTGFSPYVEGCFWSPALAAEENKLLKNLPSEAKSPIICRL